MREGEAVGGLGLVANEQTSELLCQLLVLSTTQRRGLPRTQPTSGGSTRRRMCEITGRSRTSRGPCRRSLIRIRRTDRY
jgi:hypothetical protein